MKRISLTLIGLGFAAGSAFAQTSMEMSEIDTDADGMVTFEELVAAYPDTTEDQFNTMDANTDGSLDEAEITAAVEAGTLTKDPT